MPPGNATPEDRGSVCLGLAKAKALDGVFPGVPDEVTLETKETSCLGLEKENALGALAADVPDGCLELPTENVPTGMCPGIPGKAGPEAAGVVLLALPKEKAPTGRFPEVPNETGPGCNGPFSVGPAPGN